MTTERPHRERNPPPWCDATMESDELAYACDRLPGHDGPHRDRDIAEWIDPASDRPAGQEGLGPPAAGSPAYWAERAVMRCSSDPFTQRTICQSCATHSIRSALAGERRRALAVVQHARNHYSEDIFDPEGTSTECRSAKWARGLLDGIMEDIREEIAAQPPSGSVAAVQDDRQEGKPGDIRTEAIRDCAAVARNTGREYERDKRRAKLAGDNEEVIFLDGMVKACARVAAKLDDLTVPKALTTERIEDDIQF